MNSGIWFGASYGGTSILNGMTIREIAKQTGQSDVFIGRLIRNTLKIT